MEWPGLGPGSVPSSPLLGPACVRPGPTATQGHSSPFLEPTPLPLLLPFPPFGSYGCTARTGPYLPPSPPCAAVCKTNPFLLPLFSSLSSPNRLLSPLTLPPHPPPSSLSLPQKYNKNSALNGVVIRYESLAGGALSKSCFINCPHSS